MSAIKNSAKPSDAENLERLKFILLAILQHVKNGTGVPFSELQEDVHLFGKGCRSLHKILIEKMKFLDIIGSKNHLHICKQNEHFLKVRNLEQLTPSDPYFPHFLKKLMKEVMNYVEVPRNPDLAKKAKDESNSKHDQSLINQTKTIKMSHITDSEKVARIKSFLLYIIEQVKAGKRIQIWEFAKQHNVDWSAGASNASKILTTKLKVLDLIPTPEGAEDAPSGRAGSHATYFKLSDTYYEKYENDIDRFVKDFHRKVDLITKKNNESKRVDKKSAKKKAAQKKVRAAVATIKVIKVNKAEEVMSEEDETLSLFSQKNKKPKKTNGHHVESELRDSLSVGLNDLQKMWLRVHLKDVMTNAGTSELDLLFAKQIYEQVS